VYPPAKLVLVATKGLIAAFGICAAAWAASVTPTYRHEAALRDAAQSILQGATLNQSQLGLLKGLVELAAPDSIRSLTKNDIAVIRLHLLEKELAAKKVLFSEFEPARLATLSALAGTPTNSFAWLTLCWMQPRTEVDKRAAFLRMSYVQGPNESWIAVRRFPVTLQSLSVLPDDLVGRVPVEFAGFVRSGLYDRAARLLEGVDPVIQQRLVAQLAHVDEENRRRFAELIEYREGLDHLSVPGIDNPPPRRYWR